MVCRCARVWLGANDLQEEVGHPPSTRPQGVWRDSETDEVLDLAKFWGPGQVTTELAMIIFRLSVYLILPCSRME